VVLVPVEDEVVAAHPMYQDERRPLGPGVPRQGDGGPVPGRHEIGFIQESGVHLRALFRRERRSLRARVRLMDERWKYAEEKKDTQERRELSAHFVALLDDLVFVFLFKNILGFG